MGELLAGACHVVLPDLDLVRVVVRGVQVLECLQGVGVNGGFCLPVTPVILRDQRGREVAPEEAQPSPDPQGSGRFASSLRSPSFAGEAQQVGPHELRMGGSCRTSALRNRTAVMMEDFEIGENLDFPARFDRTLSETVILAVKAVAEVEGADLLPN